MAVTYQTLIVGDVPLGWSPPPRRAVDAVSGTRFELRDTRTCRVFR